MKKNLTSLSPDLINNISKNLSRGSFFKLEIPTIPTWKFIEGHDDKKFKKSEKSEKFNSEESRNILMNFCKTLYKAVVDLNNKSSQDWHTFHFSSEKLGIHIGLKQLTKWETGYDNWRERTPIVTVIIQALTPQNGWKEFEIIYRNGIEDVNSAEVKTKRSCEVLDAIDIETSGRIAIKRMGPSADERERMRSGFNYYDALLSFKPAKSNDLGNFMATSLLLTRERNDLTEPGRRVHAALAPAEWLGPKDGRELYARAARRYEASPQVAAQLEQEELERRRKQETEHAQFMRDHHASMQMHEIQRKYDQSMHDRILESPERLEHQNLSSSSTTSSGSSATSATSSSGSSTPSLPQKRILEPQQNANVKRRRTRHGEKWFKGQLGF